MNKSTIVQTGPIKDLNRSLIEQRQRETPHRQRPPQPPTQDKIKVASNAPIQRDRYQQLMNITEEGGNGVPE
jgi:hypothetical protein